MATSISFNGVVYSIPETGDESWGESLTSYFVAIPQGALQKTGGAFTLTADVNFGANFGVLSKYFSTRSSNPSSVGLVRLALADTIGWRNNANSGNLLLAVNGSDQLTFNGSAVYPGGITALTGDVTATGPGSVAATVAFVGGYSAANVAAGATLANAAVSANTASAIVKRDGSGNFVAGTITAALTGTASGNTTYTANNHGLVVSGSSNVMSVIAPDSSTTKVLVSGGAGSNPVWQDIATGALALGAFGSTPSASGASLSAGTLTLQPADATHPGGLSILAQAIAGVKTFSSAPVFSSVTVSQALIVDSGKSLSSIGYGSAATASTLVSRDANANTNSNNISSNYATTATGAGTTALTVASARNQFFTGVTTQNVTLPDATTLPQTGFQFFIVNASSGAVTVKDAGGNSLQVMAGDSFATYTAKSIGSSNGSWQSSYSVNNAGGGTVTSVAMTVPTALFAASPVTGSPVTTSGTLALTLATQTAGTFFAGPTSGSAASPTFRALQVPTTQIFTSGTAQTYTPPAGLLYAIVTVVGGGGGGGGSSFTSGGSGGGGGGGGGISIAIVSAATMGASKTFTVGAGGAGGANTTNPGGSGTSGGTSTFGSTIASATGGAFGTGGLGPNSTPGAGGAAGVGSSGTLNYSGGGGGGAGHGIASTVAGTGGLGGSSFGGGGFSANGSAGGAGGNYGSGGAGGSMGGSGSGTAGAGAGGIIIVEELYQ